MLAKSLSGDVISLWMLPVFLFCVWLGLRSSRRCVGHWVSFFFFPVVLSITVLCSLLMLKNVNCFLYYLLTLWIGCSIGLIMTNRVPAKIDVMLQNVDAPGSRLLLICLLALCVSKCVFSMLSPDQIVYFRAIDFMIKGLVTGLLTGQALSFLYRFAVADKFYGLELEQGRFVFFTGLAFCFHDCASCGIKECPIKLRAGSLKVIIPISEPLLDQFYRRGEASSL